MTVFVWKQQGGWIIGSQSKQTLCGFREQETKSPLRCGWAVLLLRKSKAPTGSWEGASLAFAAESWCSFVEQKQFYGIPSSDKATV